ncbi:MAG: hypothetical protein LBF80_04180 [Spirochaetaceae bacterium]|jgi:hypothetical protein|nr:hypothetical protein [Spirochaetaceae bacterium]
MKLRVFHKIVALSALYFCLFLLLAFVQFAERDGLNRRIGSLHVNGSFKRQRETAMYTGEDSQAVEDGVTVSFGGMEFHLTGNMANGLAYTDNEGLIKAAYPETVRFSENEVHFQLTGGQELSFYVDNDTDTKELTISVLVKDDIEHIMLPFNINDRAVIESNESGNFIVKYNNAEYMFETPRIDQYTRRILLGRVNPVAFYRVIQGGEASNFSDFIVSGGSEKPLYNEIVQRWCDSAFIYWERLITEGNAGENIVISYLAEAARRGALIPALNMIPAAFRRQSVSFLSAPFLGRLNASMRGLTLFEQGKMDAIASDAKTNPAIFLTEKRLFEYLARRGNYELFETGIEYIKALSSASLPDFEMCAGVLEGWLAWNVWRPDIENPFEEILTKTLTQIFAYMKKDKASGYVFAAGYDVDMLYNIRLGAALTAYGEKTNNNAWAAIGRSLVISVLSFTAPDNGALVSGRLELSSDGGFTIPESADRLTAEEIYSELGYSNFYPHAAGSGTPVGAVWLWTVSPSVVASFANNVLDFGVTFPPGASHYLYIMNVKPFSGIQLRNIYWRSDPQFEQYDAPGWLYSAAEQILMLKIAQLEEVEHIKIMY